MSDCFKPFFDVASGSSQESRNGTQYYLGFRMKSPGMDLVQFRFDGCDDKGKPKGHGAIFHYSGIVQGYASEAPQLKTINNLRNTLLFSVTAEEFKASESFIGMLRENGIANPYYFTRELNASVDRERNGQKPLRFDGSIKPEYADDPCEHFMRANDSVPVVGINCSYLAIEIVQKIVGIDLSKIHQDLPDAWTGTLYQKAYNEICSAMVEGNMPHDLKRECMVFDQDEALLASFTPVLQTGKTADVKLLVA